MTPRNNTWYPCGSFQNKQTIKLHMWPTLPLGHSGNGWPTDMGSGCFPYEVTPVLGWMSLYGVNWYDICFGRTRHDQTQEEWLMYRITVCLLHLSYCVSSSNEGGESLRLIENHYSVQRALPHSKNYSYALVQGLCVGGVGTGVRPHNETSNTLSLFNSRKQSPN